MELIDCGRAEMNAVFLMLYRGHALRVWELYLRKVDLARGQAWVLGIGGTVTGTETPPLPWPCMSWCWKLPIPDALLKPQHLFTQCYMAWPEKNIAQRQCVWASGTRDILVCRVRRKIIRQLSVVRMEVTAEIERPVLQEI